MHESVSESRGFVRSVSIRFARTPVKIPPSSDPTARKAVKTIPSSE